MEKRNTIQRQLVLQAVRTLHPDHPTAENVYAQVVQQHPSVSKATVYRNLNSLAQDGQLRRVSMPSDADRFDDTLKEHYHLRCAKCGRLVDLPLPYLDKLNAQAEQNSGCKVVAHNLVFTGICNHCKDSV